MMRFKALDLPEEWLWIQATCYVKACEDSQGIVAYDKNDRIVACFVADNFTPDGCNVHVTIANPLAIKYGFLHEAAKHLFITCNRTKIFGLVPATNKKALKLDTHIGFREVARVPDGYEEGVDCIILRMDRATCPWLNEQKRAA